MNEQFPKINKPEGAEKNGDFWEKKYDDGNDIERTMLFCPSCGAQIPGPTEGFEAGMEIKCETPECGFEGKTAGDSSTEEMTA